MEVDWQCQTIAYVDRESGEIKPAHLFVEQYYQASSYPFFAYAYEDTKKTANWIDAHVRAYGILRGYF